MNKKGASIVELIAVIIVMGIIASISTVVVIAVINRQRVNATLSSLNNIYESTKGSLVLVETGNYDENIIIIDNNFAYISLTTLIESGSIDGKDYKPEDNEIYFCYDMHNTWVLIDNTISTNKPNSTNVSLVNEINVTFDYETDKFIKV